MSTAALSSSDFDLGNGGFEPPEDGGKQQSWLIQGVNEEGQRFRPGDWAERLSSLVATFKDNRLQYSAMLYPLMINGIRCIHLDDRLKSLAPGIHMQVMEFVRSNQLNVVESL